MIKTDFPLGQNPAGEGDWMGPLSTTVVAQPAKKAPPHGVGQLVARLQAVSTDHGRSPAKFHSLFGQEGGGLVYGSSTHMDVEIDEEDDPIVRNL